MQPDSVRFEPLPGDLQKEALHYLDYLLLRQQAEAEDRQWTQFSAAQLLKQYAPEDAVYDQE
jgi:hypothetical protein